MSANRRKSVINLNAPRTENTQISSAAELERLEQETTLVLQEIDHNLSRANAIINDKMFPVLKKYAAATGKMWESVGFWKSFMEEAADIEIEAQNDKLPPQTIAPTQAPQALHSPETNHEKVYDHGGDGSTSRDDEPNTSTPNKKASASTLLPSEHLAASAGRNANPLRLVVSPRKHTPTRSERRVSILTNFMDSSPPLPERPILLSDAGRQASHSSSFIGRAARENTPSQEDSDELNSNLVRLSPIALGDIASTPREASRKRSAEDDLNLAKDPTPPILHSVQRTNKRLAHGETRQLRYSDQHRDLIDNINDPNGQFHMSPPRMTSALLNQLHKANASEVAQNQNTEPRDLNLREYNSADISGSPVRRNVLMHEFESDTNVFTVDNKTATGMTEATTTEFHTVVEGEQGVSAAQNARALSRSFSQMIEDVLDDPGGNRTQ